MSDTVRWIIVVVAAVLVVGLLGWARGAKHHHGTSVGSSLGRPAAAAAATSLL